MKQESLENYAYGIRDSSKSEYCNINKWSLQKESY